MGITGKVGSIRRPTVAGAEELTGMQAMAARIACQQMTAPARLCAPSLAYTWRR